MVLLGHMMTIYIDAHFKSNRVFNHSSNKQKFSLVVAGVQNAPKNDTKEQKKKTTTEMFLVDRCIYSFLIPIAYRL